MSLDPKRQSLLVAQVAIDRAQHHARNTPSTAPRQQIESALKLRIVGDVNGLDPSAHLTAQAKYVKSLTSRV